MLSDAEVTAFALLLSFLKIFLSGGVPLPSTLLPKQLTAAISRY